MIDTGETKINEVVSLPPGASECDNNAFHISQHTIKYSKNKQEVGGNFCSVCIQKLRIYPLFSFLEPVLKHTAIITLVFRLSQNMDIFQKSFRMSLNTQLLTILSLYHPPFKTTFQHSETLTTPPKNSHKQDSTKSLQQDQTLPWRGGGGNS